MSQRRDTLTSLHVEVALLYQALESTEEAKEYLFSHDVALATVLRVLYTTDRRQPDERLQPRWV